MYKNVLLILLYRCTKEEELMMTNFLLLDRLKNIISCCLIERESEREREREKIVYIYNRLY